MKNCLLPPTKLVILDRDGVINYDSDRYIKSPSEWIAIPDSLEAIKLLNQHQIKVAVATNQSGLARGFFKIETLNSIHHKMMTQLSDCGGHLDALYYCPHHPDENCFCRKPNPGLLINIHNQFNIAWENTLMIGDSLKDVQAADNAGCNAFLVNSGLTPYNAPFYCSSKEIKVFLNLYQAVEFILLNNSYSTPT